MRPGTRDPKRPGTRDPKRLARVRQLAASGEARRIRLKAKLSLNDVGRPVGVSHTAILNWELGRRRPTGDAAFRYLEVLDAVVKAVGE